MADGLGTTGQELQVLGKGGAVVDSLTGGLQGAQTPDAYHTASRAADNAMGAVGTAMMEMGGTLVGAIASFGDQEAASAQGIAATGEPVR
ncbi:hypothetical protein [Nocardia mexicana]|uniref:hypothetical protein n=1 Tax=Nocardia mexicana TaxID=279262 RepID=UPI000835D2A7|nr:hypothetical protein [Nocardia mexicana]